MSIAQNLLKVREKFFLCWFCRVRQLSLSLVLTVLLLLLAIALISLSEWVNWQTDHETLRAVLIQWQVKKADQVAAAIDQAQAVNSFTPMLCLYVTAMLGISAFRLWLSRRRAQALRYLSQVSQAGLAWARNSRYLLSVTKEIDPLRPFCAPRVQQLQESFAHILAQSEAKFSTIFRVSPDAIGITRLSDLQIIEVNDCYLELFGYSREVILAKK
ncbi:PAS domain S-box protein [Trichothermofontia sp.]